MRARCRVEGVEEAVGEKPEDERRCWDVREAVLELKWETCARERG